MFIQAMKTLSEGFSVTMTIFFMTLLIAIPLGALITLGSRSKIKAIRYPVKGFIWVIRGTPLMLQLMLLYFGPGILSRSATMALNNGGSGFFLEFMANMTIPSSFVAAIVGFSINYACYFSEIYRGGIESIPVGQYEAGQTLGLSKFQIFRKVVLLQVVKRIVPPMGNEIITLVKDTALASAISYHEIIYKAKSFSTQHAVFWPLFCSGIFYLIFCGLLTLLFNKAEKKLDYFRG